MEWIVEAETIEDLVDGPMLISKKLVRCKDCRYLKTGENESESWSICARMIVYPYVDVGPNDYCSYGERRTE